LKFQVEGVVPTNHSSCQETRLNDLSYGIKSRQVFLRFVTMHAFDRQTDGQTSQTYKILIARPRLQSMQRGKNWLYLEDEFELNLV